MRSWLSIALLVAACGNDVGMTAGDDGPPPPDPDQCASSYLGYDNFGAPFLNNWCRGCHSEDLIPTMRQNAPLGVNLDTLDEVRARKNRIIELAGTSDEMPPNGGPSAQLMA